METDTLVVGGGLSGLYLANLLARKGYAFHLLEARDRFGGRILGWSGSVREPAAGGSDYDMGPAWFWPGQPRMERLLTSLDLRFFQQYAQGALAFEDEAGRVRRDLMFAPMAGSLRVAGGFSALVDALAKALPANSFGLNCRVVRVLSEESVGRIEVRFVDGLSVERAIYCNRVVLAVPPRLAAERIAFSPNLPDVALDTMRGIYTWMAGHGKVMAIYDKPFWRELGMSGDAMSHRGPLAEIHDATRDARPDPTGLDTTGAARYEQGALFGFFGIPASVRGQLQAEGKLERAVLDQLVRLFGPDAAYPTALHIKDWARDSLTAVAADETPPPGHPVYGLPPSLNNLWDGALILSSSEAATEFGGFLEGALEAAESTLRRILDPTVAGR